MIDRLLRLCAMVALVSVLIVGCAPAAAPSPTAAPAKPAAEPTKPAAAPATATVAAPTAQPATSSGATKPAAAPARAGGWPEPGKMVSVIVPYNAGGPIDALARIEAALFEKELGTTVQVVNKPGAGSQTGTVELVKSKPDGYTVALISIPAAITLYLDPDRQAPFSSNDILKLGMETVDTQLAAVNAEGPYKTLKDVIDAAKANPGKVRAGTTGILSANHITILKVEQLTGAKFATVHFDGGAPMMTSLLGGQTDISFDSAAGMMPQIKSGNVRPLAVLGTEPNRQLPDVATAESQGFKIYGGTTRGYILPAGTPKEIVDTWSAALQKALSDPEHVNKVSDLGIDIRYMDPAQYSAYWEEQEAELKPLVELAKSQ